MKNKTLNQSDDWIAFKIFAKLHPTEAYELRPDDFCDFMRSEGIDLTNEEIRKLIHDY